MKSTTYKNLLYIQQDYFTTQLENDTLCGLSSFDTVVGHIVWSW